MKNKDLDSVEDNSKKVNLSLMNIIMFLYKIGERIELTYFPNYLD